MTLCDLCNWNVTSSTTANKAREKAVVKTGKYLEKISLVSSHNICIIYISDTQ